MNGIVETDQEYKDRMLIEYKARIEQLENDCIKAKDMIRNLRDSDLHICPADGNDMEDCSCEEFDRIIDVLSD
jgi:hypothetical protein